MTLEYLDLMEDVKRRKCIKSFKSNTRVFDDDSIEVIPREKGEPSQKDVKKVGRSKRYTTNGKKPLTCIELKCPADVPDKAAFFQKELARLIKDIEIKEPVLPKSEYLINNNRLKVCYVKKEQKVKAWLTFEAKGLLELRRELYSLTSEIDKCFVINESSVCPRKQ